MSECSKCKSTKRDEKEKKLLTNRLLRVEGQIRGIIDMVKEDSYCIDIITQVQAANAALKSFSRALLNEHMRRCVKRDILSGDESTLDELDGLFERMMK